MSLVNHTPAWHALDTHWQEMRQVQMRDLFDRDPQRAAEMTLRTAGLHVDYSKNIVTQETLGLLYDLATAVDLQGWIQRMLDG